MKDEFVDARLGKKKEEAHDPGEDATDPGTNRATKIFIAVAGVVVIGFLVYLLLGAKESTQERVTVEYNYFTFEQVGGFWETTVQLDGQPFVAPFRFNPEQVGGVNISGNFSGFRGEPIYITFDPDVERDAFKHLALASSELSLHVVRALNFTVEAACTRNVSDACINRSIVTCDDLDKDVIYLRASPPTEIVLDGRCVTVGGEGLDILKSVDRLLFRWYKIM